MIHGIPKFNWGVRMEFRRIIINREKEKIYRLFDKDREI